MLTQVILLASLPFIAHFYTAEQIGQWAICTTICSIIITTGGGKFYFSILASNEPKLNNHLTWLTIISASFFSIILIFVLYVLANWWGTYTFLWESDLHSLMIIVLGLYCFAAINNLLLEHLLTIREEWKFLSLVRLTKAIVYLLVIYLCRSLGVLSLLLALFTGQMLGLLLIWAFKFKMRLPTMFIRKELKQTLIDHKHNINFGMSKSFVINAYEHVMAVWIQSIYGAAMLGQFSMVDRLARFPMQGLGQPISERLYQKLGISLPKDIYPILRKYLLSIYILTGMLGICFALFGPYLLFLLFGDKWSISAGLMQYYVLWIPAIFCLASIRNLPFVLKAQKAFFLLELGLYLILILSFWYFSSMELDFEKIIELKILLESLLFVGATILMTRLSRNFTKS